MLQPVRLCFCTASLRLSLLFCWIIRSATYIRVCNRVLLLMSLRNVHITFPLTTKMVVPLGTFASYSDVCTRVGLISRSFTDAYGMDVLDLSPNSARLLGSSSFLETVLTLSRLDLPDQSVPFAIGDARAKCFSYKCDFLRSGKHFFFPGCRHLLREWVL